eukprot:480228-Rhodomonas_salina.6
MQRDNLGCELRLEGGCEDKGPDAVALGGSCRDGRRVPQTEQVALARAKLVLCPSLVQESDGDAVSGLEFGQRNLQVDVVRGMPLGLGQSGLWTPV